MASRPPFDVVQLREEFRRQLDEIPGVELPPSKLELRPGFQLEILRHLERRDAVIQALAWFITTTRGGGSSSILGGPGEGSLGRACAETAVIQLGTSWTCESASRALASLGDFGRADLARSVI